MEPTIKLTDGTTILVQSCDTDWAHICVDDAEKRLCCHVDVPSLKRQYHEFHPWEFTGAKFDTVMQQNGAAILDLIQRLNQQ